MPKAVPVAANWKEAQAHGALLSAPTATQKLRPVLTARDTAGGVRPEYPESGGGRRPSAAASSSAADRSHALRSSTSPASGLFDTTYQGGASVDVFSAGGSNPTSNWKVSGAVQRVYEKSVKGYVFQCEGGPSAKMQLPKDERRLLGLLQPYLVFQLLVPAGKPFALELSISDTTRARRRLLFSTSFREPSRTPLHSRLPLSALQRDVWLNLTFDLVDLVASNFSGATFARLESLTLSAVRTRTRAAHAARQPPVSRSRSQSLEEAAPHIPTMASFSHPHLPFHLRPPTLELRIPRAPNPP